jgi:crotonobetainyl-CoA:carnitine CoA-transferase CaiB-like acyl-CoA transferase
VQIYPHLPRLVEPSGAETNIMFAGFSRSVRDIALDMKSPEDSQTFLRLLAEADVLIDNFATGVMDRWDLGVGRLREVNDQLVHVSISGYGRTGPKARTMAYGMNISAYLGLSRVWAPHGTQFDYTAVAHALVAILAGLEHRDRTGSGSYVDLAQTEAGAAVMAPLYLNHLVNGATDPGIEPASPNDVAGSLLSGVFACLGADEWVAVELEDETDWNVACRVVERPDLTRSAVELDGAPDEQLREALTAWCATRTPYQAMFDLQRAGLAAGAVQDTEDLYLDAQHRSRGFIVDIDHPDIGPLEYPGPFHHFSKTDVRVRRPAPRLGEHTAQVLEEWLGLDPGSTTAKA